MAVDHGTDPSSTGQPSSSHRLVVLKQQADDRSSREVIIVLGAHAKGERVQRRHPVESGAQLRRGGI
jgi:hypothetical protein